MVYTKAVKRDMPTDTVESTLTWPAAPVLLADAPATVLVMTLVIGGSVVGVGLIKTLPGIVVVINTTDARSVAGIALPTPVPVH